MRPKRIAVIGAGAIAQTHANAIAQSRLTEMAAVVDVRAAAAAAMAEATGSTAYTNVGEMLRGERPDAAIVCTPPATHIEVAEKLLSAGVHVLCEKPLAISPKGARQMVATAQRHGVLLTMASKFRCVDDVIQAKALVQSGTIGDVVLFENVFAAHVDMQHRWNSDPSVSGGGVLIDNGTHSVDILRFFLGPLVELQVVEGKRSQGLAVEETVRVSVRTEDGVFGNIDLSWSIDKEQPAYISIYGTQGTLLVGWKQSQYIRIGDKEWTNFGSGYDKLAAFVHQLENFARAIHQQHPLIVTPLDALASVDVIDTAYTALRAAAWHPVATCHGGESGLPRPAQSA